MSSQMLFCFVGMQSGGEFEHSALRAASPSPLCPLIQRLYKSSSDRVTVRASGLGLLVIEPLRPDSWSHGCL